MKIVLEENIQIIRAIVNESIDFWLEYLSILKVFIEPEPSNILIFQIPDLFKYRFVDTINNCHQIEINILSASKSIKSIDISFYEKYDHEIEFQLSGMSKNSVELFINTEPSSIPPKRKFIVEYLREELVKVEKLIREMAAILHENEIAAIDRILNENKKKVSEVQATEIPNYLLKFFSKFTNNTTGISQDQFIAAIRNKAIVFFLYRLKDTELYHALIGSGEANIISMAANISSGDISFIVKLMTSPKVQDELRAFRISKQDEQRFFTGNKEFYKMLYKFVKNYQPKEEKPLRRSFIKSLNGELPILELFKQIGQIKIDTQVLNLRQL